MDNPETILKQLMSALEEQSKKLDQKIALLENKIDAIDAENNGIESEDSDLFSEELADLDNLFSQFKAIDTQAVSAALQTHSKKKV